MDKLKETERPKNEHKRHESEINLEEPEEGKVSSLFIVDGSDEGAILGSK